MNKSPIVLITFLLGLGSGIYISATATAHPESDCPPCVCPEPMPCPELDLYEIGYVEYDMEETVMMPPPQPIQDDLYMDSQDTKAIQKALRAIEAVEQQQAQTPSR